MMCLQVVFDTEDELQTNPVQTPAVFKPTKTSFWNTHTHTRPSWRWFVCSRNRTAESALITVHWGIKPFKHSSPYLLEQWSRTFLLRDFGPESPFNISLIGTGLLQQHLIVYCFVWHQCYDVCLCDSCVVRELTLQSAVRSRCLLFTRNSAVMSLGGLTSLASLYCWWSSFTRSLVDTIFKGQDKRSHLKWGQVRMDKTS